MISSNKKTAMFDSLKNLSDLSKGAQVGGHDSKRVLTVPVDQVISKTQVRKIFNDIEELAESLKIEGQQSPIIVSPKNDQGEYVIQKGERRWRAAILAGLGSVNILVNDAEQSELDEVAGELIENIQRDALKSIEIAVALNRFAQSGWDQKAIAARIGKSKAFVSRHLSLIKLPEPVERLTDKGVTYDADTLNFLRQSHEINADVVTAFCLKAENQGSVSRKEAKTLFDSLKKKPKDLPSKPVGGESQSSSQVSNSIQPAGEQQDRENKGAPAETGLDNGLGSAWSSVDPASLQIQVNVINDFDSKPGILILDRLSRDSSKAWVKVNDGTKNKVVLVSLNNIEVIAITAG